MSRPHPQKVILLCIFHQEPMIKKWLFMLFAINRVKTVTTPPQSFAKTTSDPLQWWVCWCRALMMQFKFMRMSYMRPFPFSMVKPGWEKRLRDYSFVFWHKLLWNTEGFFFPVWIAFFKKSSCLQQKSVLDTKALNNPNSLFSFLIVLFDILYSSKKIEVCSLARRQEVPSYRCGSQ